MKKFKVESTHLSRGAGGFPAQDHWSKGTVLTETDLAGSDIDALVACGALSVVEYVQAESEKAAPAPQGGPIEEYSGPVQDDTAKADKSKSK